MDIPKFFFCDVTVSMFIKIKFETHENIGSGPIHLPEEELHTNAAWVQVNDDERQNWNDIKLEEALLGTANVLGHVAALKVMCDPSDLHVFPQIKAVHNEKPTIFLYDRYPGGVGLSQKVYEQMPEIISEAHRLISRCPCESGCPSCIGVGGSGEQTKNNALRLLKGWKG